MLDRRAEVRLGVKYSSLIASQCAEVPSERTVGALVFPRKVSARYQVVIIIAQASRFLISLDCPLIAKLIGTTPWPVTCCAIQLSHSSVRTHSKLVPDPPAVRECRYSSWRGARVVRPCSCRCPFTGFRGSPLLRRAIDARLPARLVVRASKS